MIKFKKHIAILVICLSCFVFALSQSEAKSRAKVHPRNMKLLKRGVMKNIPKYFPQIPRITAQEALFLYKNKKALFLYVSYEDLNLIVGGVHITEGQLATMNPRKLPLKKGQMLVIYCQ